MLRAAVLLSLLRRIQRFNTASRPAALVACYVASWQLPRLDLHQLADDSFQDTPARVRPRSCKKPSTFHDLPNWRQIQGNLLVTVHTNQIIQWLLLICQDGACASPYRLASEIQVLTNMSYAYQDVFE